MFKFVQLLQSENVNMLKKNLARNIIQAFEIRTSLYNSTTPNSILFKVFKNL